MIALTLGLPSDQISIQEVREYLKFPERRKSAQLAKFLEIMRNITFYNKGFSPADVLSILTDIANDTRLQDLEEGRGDMFQASPTKYLFWMTRELLQSMADDERNQAVGQLFESENRLAISSQMLPELRKLCGDKTLEKVRCLWLDKVQQALEDRSLFTWSVRALVFHLLLPIQTVHGAYLSHL